MKDQNKNIKEYAETQYKTSKNLKSRYQLYQFGTSEIPWQNWVFSKINFFDNCNILELGCGPGELWKQNIDMIPKNSRIILSDNSEAMINVAKSSLSKKKSFIDFKKFDAQSIPYPEDMFDIVIANHMLYHCPDIDMTLQEITRVLKPNGTLYASTLDKNHLIEFTELFREFTTYLECFMAVRDRFGLENGNQVLSKYFKRVKCYTFRNNLKIPKVEPLIQYVLSNSNIEINTEIIKV